MKTIKFLLIVAFFSTGILFAQSPVPQMDNAVKNLAADLNKRLVQEKVQKISVGQYTFRNTMPALNTALGAYLNNQLSAELANIPNKTFTLISSEHSRTDWTITGEIILAADMIRVYTRLVETNNGAITAVFSLDFERNDFLTEMLSSATDLNSSSSRIYVMDSFEPDSFENPILYEIGSPNLAQAISRSIHDENDEDFFLLIPVNSGNLTIETTGNLDTTLELYNAGSMEFLTSDDDSGSGYNAKIRFTVTAEHRYIVKVSGYGSEDTGNYSFRVYQ